MRELRLWLRALLLRRRVDDEMRREMRHHLEMEVAERVRRGVPEEEARRAALVAFGGVVKAEEAVRDERRTRVVENVVADVRYALRGFVRQPAYALVVVALLALGVGGNTALFSVLYHSLIAPLPYPDASRMVALFGTGAQGTLNLPVDQSMADAWQQATRTVEQVTIVGQADFVIGDTANGATQRLSGAVLPPGASEFIGMRPELGRDIAAGDTLSGAVPVALISDGMWRRDYGADHAVLGKPILIDGLRHTIVGVVPSEYRMPFVDGSDLFIARRALPANPSPTNRQLRGSVSDLVPLGKLRPGVGVDQANREMAAIFSRWRQSTEAARFANELADGVTIDAPRVMRVVDLVQPWLRELVLVLFGAMTLVLLIACANVANVLLVRALSRQRELAVRAAMGASRARLVAQVFTESVLLAIFGAAAGIGVAALTLRAIMLSTLGQHVAGARLEPAVLAWCAGLSLVTAILFGSAPARFVAEGRMTEALKAGARSASSGAGARRVRMTLVGLEIALSVMLLAGVGLLMRTLVAMERADVGLDTRGLVSLRLYFPQSKFSAGARASAVSAIRARLAAVPGIQSVSLAAMPAPRFGIGIGGLRFEDRPVAASDSLAAIGFNSVEPAYFAHVGLRVTSGRVFQADARLTNEERGYEVMINERFARRFWPDGNAVGKRVQYGRLGWSTVVGVVHDVDIPGATDRVRSLQLYMPLSAAPFQAAFVIRSGLPPARLQSLFRVIVRDAAAVARVEEAVVADDALASARAPQRAMITLLGVFAAVALLLAAIGLHAVIAFSVSQRTREIGMRVALGAESVDVVRLVVGQGLGIALVGVVCGSAGALATTRAIQSYLYGVQSDDPITFAAVAVSMLAVAVIATLPPACRAARLDPIEALRAE